jgi:ABC-type glycerol-3-phosphate transport system permease component
METIITISNLLILGLIIFAPILILVILKKLRTKRILISYSFSSLFLLGVLVFIFAWWSYVSDLVLLKHYGYNLYGLNETELYGKVSPENVQKVKSLATSTMGIGWPLKAMFGYVTILPYLIIVYIGNILIIRRKNNRNEA